MHILANLYHRWLKHFDYKPIVPSSTFSFSLKNFYTSFVTNSDIKLTNVSEVDTRLQFLSDPGVPGVRSMGPDVTNSLSDSKTICRLN